MKIIRSKTFDKWLDSLRDSVGKARILQRLDTIHKTGHFGDTRYIADGVSELRFKSGAGYRIYYMAHGNVAVILLCAGDKSSQKKDIESAIRIAAKFSTENEGGQRND